MILLHPRAPFIFGAVMIGLLAVYLTLVHPMPGPLSSPHAAAVAQNGLADCRACHTSQGLAAGCLHCHAEIASQVKEGRGYHAFMLKDRPLTCRSCHIEHAGADFPLVSRRSWQGRDPNQFMHEHVAFKLTGAHERLACPACHQARLQGPSTQAGLTGQARPATYLGLGQDCIRCHKDVHAGALVRNCEACHSQEAFRPAKGFRHDDHFVLEGAHAKAACSACHLATGVPGTQAGPTNAEPNSLRLAFGQVRGKTCQQCHTSPHRARLGQDCTQCHLGSDAAWALGRRGMLPEVHARTGFPLDGAHGQVACEKCHAPGLTYVQRHPDPAAPGYLRQAQTCQGCHADVHKGQFVGRYGQCLDCHDKGRFVPSSFTVQRHATRYALTGAHAALPCEECHTVDAATGVRRYVSTPTTCQACHKDPHGGQFATGHSSCLDCHNQDRLSDPVISTAQHAQWYPLEGAHARLACKECHASVDAATGMRRYVSTPRTCQACHKDPHGGQFAAGHSTCLDCHNQDRFSPSQFTLTQHSQRYPLSGGHAAVPCIRCHTVQGTPGVRRFVSTPQRCQACHSDPHEGQFSRELAAGDCTSCHRADVPAFSIRPFEHGQRTGYELTGAHAKARCQECHKSQEGRAQTTVAAAAMIYRGTSRACASCHRDVHLGQFQEGGTTRCERCHGSTGRWTADRFDHNRDSRFPLEGAHARTRCQECHPRILSKEGASLVQYRPLKSRCEDCHGSLAK